MARRRRIRRGTAKYAEDTAPPSPTPPPAAPRRPVRVDADRYRTAVSNLANAGQAKPASMFKRAEIGGAGYGATVETTYFRDPKAWGQQDPLVGVSLSRGGREVRSESDSEFRARTGKNIPTRKGITLPLDVQTAARQADYKKFYAAPGGTGVEKLAAMNAPAVAAATTLSPQDARVSAETIKALYLSDNPADLEIIRDMIEANPELANDPYAKIAITRTKNFADLPPSRLQQREAEKALDARLAAAVKAGDKELQKEIYAEKAITPLAYIEQVKKDYEIELGKNKYLLGEVTWFEDVLGALAKGEGSTPKMTWDAAQKRLAALRTYLSKTLPEKKKQEDAAKLLASKEQAKEAKAEEKQARVDADKRFGARVKSQESRTKGFEREYKTRTDRRKQLTQSSFPLTTEEKAELKTLQGNQQDPGSIAHAKHMLQANENTLQGMYDKQGAEPAEAPAEPGAEAAPDGTDVQSGDAETPGTTGSIDAPIPRPATKAELVIGKYYLAADGSVGKWTGKGFEVSQ